MRTLRLVPKQLLATILVAGLLSGCGKDNPVKPKEIAVLTYPVLSSPQNALSALVTAYTQRDSVETGAVYDSSYQGSSQDLTDPNNPPTLFFTHSDEVHHVAALARSPAITEIIFNIGSPATWTRLASDDASHPEWAVIQIFGHYIGIRDGATEYDAYGTNPFLFKFKPSTPDSSSPTDTLWRVVRWTEIH